MFKWQAASQMIGIKAIYVHVFQLGLTSVQPIKMQFTVSIHIYIKTVQKKRILQCIPIHSSVKLKPLDGSKYRRKIADSKGFNI